MSPIMESQNFPRGGKIFPKSLKRKHENNLFSSGNHQSAKRVRKPKLVENPVSEELWQASLNLQGTLTYNKLQEGMLLLSCVRHISNLALQVEFSGLTFGNITINNISDEFTKKLSHQLKMNNELCFNASKNVIQVGQFIPAKIISITKTERGHEVQATTNPKIINSNKKHNSFKKGATVWANVVSELDHGYELTLGVNNCRVFLPFKNIDDSKKYHIGEPLYCIVHKVDTSDFASTLTVSAKQEHIGKCERNDLLLDDVLPGMKVDFWIEEISSKGIKGHFFENCFGYIDETQLSTIKIERLKEGNSIPAYVLFVEYITKVTYLTLRGLQNSVEPLLKVGKIISAKVSSAVPRGLYLELDKNCLGFITNKRLLNTLPKDARLNVIEAVKKKYQIGSRHDCRVLDYNYMEQLYICTFEKQLISEKVFSIKDLNVGQIVKITVDKIVSNGLIVKSGHIQGFVPNLHLFSVKYSENLKTKFSIGMSIAARVLNITSEDSVLFTLKQGMIESDKCLMKMEDAHPGLQYNGFVVQTKISGALIAFYGNVKGWISNKVLNAGNMGRYTDPRDYFFIGQVVTVWILGLKDNKLQVSLYPPNNEKMKKIKIGEHFDGKITAVHANEIDVLVGPGKLEATVPTAHLCSNTILCAILQKTYKRGQTIKDLMCVNNSGIVPVMSRRESIAYKKHSLKVSKLRDLKRNMLIRCSFEENSDSGIYVSAAITDYPERIFIPSNNIICHPGEPLPTFTKQQCIVAKVLNVDYVSKQIDLLINNGSVVNKDNVADTLTETIEDIQYVIQLHEEKNAKLTNHKVGDRVKCTVRNIDASGDLLVSIPNGADGLIPAHLKPGNCTVGSDVEGVILDYNFIDNSLVICGKNGINQKINRTQDGIINKSFYSSCMAKVVYMDQCYAIGVPNDSHCNRQLVYLPLYFKESKRPSFEVKMKLVIYKRVGNRIIAVPKKFLSTLNKTTIKQERKKKRKNGAEPLQKIEGITESDDDDEMSNEVNSNVEEFEVKSLDDIVICEKREQKDKTVKESILSGTSNFYCNVDEANMNESSSEDEEETETRIKKKKMTASERIEAAKREEERISKIEKELADTATTPQTAEQFDRLLLANPNSSQLWLQYISMHVAATELEKARSIGKKALESINMTLIKEKFNVWIALLNLENMYGTKESFGQLFEEAVKYNDACDIYLNVIKMFASSGKLLEMEEKIKKLKNKDKQNPNMWLEIGRVYYSLNKFKEARNIKEAALKSILDKKRQFDLIVRFGIMEFQLGDLEHAIANFEAILETCPTKVNIWTVYVDQLVKKNKIELARQVLERCVRQKFNVKIMKILFQKFISFEEQHGTSELIEKVKNRAKEYLADLGVK